MTLTPVRARPPRPPATGRTPVRSRQAGRRTTWRTITALPALVLLATLTGSVTAATSDNGQAVHVPAAGPIRYPQPTVTHLHYRHWKLDPDRPHHGLVMSDVQLWWDTDGTALIQRCDVVEDPTSTHISQPRTMLGPCPDTWHLTAGQYQPRIPDPLPETPAALGNRLAAFADGSSDHALIAAAVDMLREHHLNPRQRSALLAILADMPGITYRGTTTDRAGRTAEAFSLDSALPDGSTITDLLIIDPGDGTLLGYDKVVRTPGPGSSLKPMTVIETIVYLDSQRTDVIPGTNAMTCGQHTCAAARPSWRPTAIAARPAARPRIEQLEGMR